MLRRIARNYLTGITVGGADLIPGVSGGTVALITGVYEKLIASIAQLLAVPRRVFSLEAWKRQLSIDWVFLVSLLAGMGSAVAAGAAIIPGLLTSAPIATFGFFSGAIAVSTVLLGWNLEHHDKRKHAHGFVWLGIGALVGAAIAFLPTGLSAPVSPLLTFVAGLLALTAMLLPGISGSYVLLIIGYYPHVLNAVASLNLGFLIVFAVGAAIGAGLISKAIKVLLKRWHIQTMLLLLGLVAGALGKPLSLAIAPIVSVGGVLVLLGFGLIGAILAVGLTQLGRINLAAGD